jgi:hypothetical protein
MGSNGSVMAMGKSKVANAALVAFQNNQRVLGYRPTSALHSCTSQCNRPTRSSRSPERAEARHIVGNSALGVACAGLIDRRYLPLPAVSRSPAVASMSLHLCHPRPVNGYPPGNDRGVLNSFTFGSPFRSPRGTALAAAIEQVVPPKRKNR